MKILDDWRTFFRALTLGAGVLLAAVVVWPLPKMVPTAGLAFSFLAAVCFLMFVYDTVFKDE
jgi:hypothetical protein